MRLQTFDKYTAVSKRHETYLKELAAAAAGGPYRPKAHICPPCGLLNDPNGLCWYGGWYHVFYQWHPFGPSHGMKHWAHVRSKNLADWEWCDEMLVPTENYEKNGCYSGNAYVNPADGKCYLFYTANYKTENGRIPKQAVAVMDDSGTIRKYEGNPVIDGAPEGMGGDIRDPFVFERDGRYYMLLGAADQDGKGQLILYSGADLYSWEYEGIIRILADEAAGGRLDLGTMVECPGVIRVDGRDVLLISLIGIEPQGDRCRNQFSSLALVGELDLSRMEFRAETVDELDCGFDFYAPQPFYGEGGQPMLFGWFGCGEQKLPDDEYHWRHALTLPRVLRVRDGHLFMTPSEQVLRLFDETVLVPSRPEGRIDPGACMCLRWNISDDGDTHTLSVGTEEDFWTLAVDFSSGMMTWDRSTLKIPVDVSYGAVRACHFQTCSQMEVLICMDNSFVEIYAQNGERVMSGRCYQNAVPERV